MPPIILISAYDIIRSFKVRIYHFDLSIFKAFNDRYKKVGYAIEIWYDILTLSSWKQIIRTVVYAAITQSLIDFCLTLLLFIDLYLSSIHNCCVWIIGKSLSLKLTYYAVAEVDTVITLSPLIRIVPRLLDLSCSSNNSTESRKNKFICWSYRTKVPVIIFLPFSLMSTDLPMFSWRTFPIMSTDDNSSLTGIQTI